MEAKWVEQQSYAFPMFHGFFDHHSFDSGDLKWRGVNEINMGGPEMQRYGGIGMVDSRGDCGGDSKGRGPHKRKKQEAEGRKRKEKKGRRDADVSSSNGDNGSRSSKDIQKMDYIHVRARRGQATDSHSLAERARREKISKKMKYLQDLVPGCIKVAGRAGMLDEIINYVQSLQKQVEFLSMKLAAFSPVHHPIIQETEHPSCLENYVEMNLTQASMVNHQDIERKSLENAPILKVPSAWEINHSSVPLNPSIMPSAFPLCSNGR